MKKAFTLIELLVVMAIVAILVTVGVPKYNDYVLKARAEEAKATIMAISMAQERYYQEYGKYYPDKPNSGTNTVYNENIISSVLKVNLASANNFHFTVQSKGDEDENYEIIATLRANSGTDYGKLCTNTTNVSDKCKQETAQDFDSWVSSYERGAGKHYIIFDYPELLTGTEVENGIDFKYLYTE